MKCPSLEQIYDMDIDNLLTLKMNIEQNKINVDDVISPENGNTLMHYAANFGYYNAIRALIQRGIIALLVFLAPSIIYYFVGIIGNSIDKSRILSRNINHKIKLINEKEKKI